MRENAIFHAFSHASALKRVVLLSLKLQILLLLFSSSLLGKTHSTSFEGLSVFTHDGLELKSLLIASIANTDGSMTMSLSSSVFARGTSPIVDIFFYKEGPPSASIERAVAVVDVIFYYVGGEKYVDLGTYYNRFLVSPTNMSNEIFYRIDFTSTINNVFTYLSAKINNLTIQDVAIGGSFSIQNEFSNSTDAVLDKGYVRFPYIFDGNMNI